MKAEGILGDALGMVEPHSFLLGASELDPLSAQAGNVTFSVDCQSEL